MKRIHPSPMSLVLSALCCFGIAIASEPMTSISGLYEVCIGVMEPVPKTPCWEFFGYRIGETGRLSSDRANILYCSRFACATWTRITGGSSMIRTADDSLCLIAKNVEIHFHRTQPAQTLHYYLA